ncbi:LysM peptidoglycan-binding domain-containing protein [Longimicrobium sp.]|uniref:LysM peptidoglycan-binding domain-containing protein n=1 Tax=Longimicrobium sp. TaxID=2029185 RepID=UPI003B3B0EC6
MRPVPLFLLILSCAAAVDAAAQTPSTRPARDSIQMAEVDEAGADENSVSVDEDEAEADTVPQPVAGPYARSGGTGPFSVQASGEVAPRPERGEVVWVNTRPARPAAAADSARRDTARAGTTTRVTSGQAARRDSASATRPASRDSAASTRPQNRPAARDTARRTGTAAAGTGRTESAPAPSGRGRAHTVVAGETFYGIARRYGVTAAQLRALNPDVDMDALEVGDELRLPAGARDSRAAAQPRPQTPAPTGGQAQQPRRGTRSHVVVAGETLFGIARRYGVTVDAIRRANQMESDQVRTGQRIVIPPAS